MHWGTVWYYYSTYRCKTNYLPLQKWCLLWLLTLNRTGWLCTLFRYLIIPLLAIMGFNKTVQILKCFPKCQGLSQELPHNQYAIYWTFLHSFYQFFHADSNYDHRNLILNLFEKFLKIWSCHLLLAPVTWQLLAFQFKI